VILKITPPHFVIATVLAITAFTACTKQGAQGPAGTANVIYSNWDTLKYKWDNTTVLIPDVGSAFYNRIDADLIDSSILKQGDVRVFMKGGEPNNNDTNIYVLPRVYRSEDYTNFILNAKKIILYNQLVGQNNAPIRPWLKSAKFRYIIIPGGKLAAARAQQKEDYQTLCNRLGIPE
jgi:signal peptidase I